MRRLRGKTLTELYGIMGQSNISTKNLRRLQQLCQSGEHEVRSIARIVLQVGLQFPRKRRRYVRMAHEDPRLLEQLRQAMGDAWWDELCCEGSLGSPGEQCPAKSEQARCRREEPIVPATNGNLKQVTVHTDGACHKNPGTGGWAAILRYGDHVRELFGGATETTNNRMELQAALAALGALKQRCAVVLFTDSKYLRDGITQWMARWKANGWRTIERTPVKNRDLWMQLDELCARHQVTWKWLKGHAGHPDNERCDHLARAEISRIRQTQPRKQLA